MSATTVMLIAWAALVLGHWSHNQKAVPSAKQVIEIVFAILVIAFLEANPSSQPVARGFAWLFLAAVLLRSDSILTGLAKTTGTGTTAPKAA